MTEIRARCIEIRDNTHSDDTRLLYIHVTIHKKIMHNALKNIFELRTPLPTTTFELLSSKFHTQLVLNSESESLKFTMVPYLSGASLSCMNVSV